MKFTNIYILGIIGSMAALLAGCKDPEFGDPKPSTTIISSKVTFVNAVPDASSLTLFTNNSPFGDAISFSGNQQSNIVASSEQFRVKNVIYKATSTDTTAKSADLVSQVTLNGIYGYTVFLTDSLTRPFGKGSGFSSNNGGARFLQVTDTLSAPKAGFAKVRFFNLSPDAPTVGVYDVTNAVFLLATKAYRSTSVLTYTLVPAGTYSLDVRASAGASPITTPSDVTFTDGKIYTVYLYGLTKNPAYPTGTKVIVHN